MTLPPFSLAPALQPVNSADSIMRRTQSARRRQLEQIYTKMQVVTKNAQQQAICD
jgi:hypothetical protein